MGQAKDDAEFRRKLDSFRMEGRPLEPAVVAHCAVEAGVSADLALREIRRLTDFHASPRSDEASQALSELVVTLCEEDKSSGPILEFTTQPYLLLTAKLLETELAKRLTVIAADVTYLEALETLLGSNGVSVLRSMAQLPMSQQYSTIICAPPVGTRTHSLSADGFSGEVIQFLLPFVAEGGMLLWVTARGAANNTRVANTLDELASQCWHTVARIETAPGAIGGMLEGIIIVLRNALPQKMFVGAVREIETAKPTAAAFLSRRTEKEGANWCWIARDDPKNFSDIERSKLLRRLVPRGRHEMRLLGSLLLTDKVEKADKPVTRSDAGGASLYIPEYAASRVTTELDEQTVKERAVYRFYVDVNRANPQFIAQLLNGPYGRYARASRASGATIQRLSAASILEIELPIPDRTIQDRLVRIAADIRLVHTALNESLEVVDSNWTSLQEVEEKAAALKQVFDIEDQIENWWRELPYPLATIYRRYRVNGEPRNRLETLLHFFEMAAVYLAAVGSSYVRSLRADWQEVLAKWLHPDGGAGIERADFGFWSGLARASLKDTNRIFSDAELRERATETVGPELVQVAAEVGKLSKAIPALDLARDCRNSWLAHGGHIKSSDAERLDRDLLQQVRDFYQFTAPTFRQLQLVRPGRAEGTDRGLRYDVEILTGSDPTFRREQIELSHTKSNVLGFWMKGTRSICRSIPFFRLGAPQRPQETSLYVFNRVDEGRFRWISFQEAQDQEIFAPEEELQALINLGRTPSGP